MAFGIGFAVFGSLIISLSTGLSVRVPRLADTLAVISYGSKSYIDTLSRLSRFCHSCYQLSAHGDFLGVEYTFSLPYISIRIRLSNHHVKGGTITVVERPVVTVSLLIVHCL